MKFNTCIFDLDGVIVDTAHLHYKAWKRLADELRIHEFDEVQNEQLKGVSRSQSLSIILEIGNVAVDAETHLVLTDRKNVWYREYISAMTPGDILPGVLHFLRQLQEYNFKLGLASSSRNAMTILRAVGLTDQFGAIIDGNKTKRAKPDPEVFLKCARELKSLPGSCIVFEDSRAGIEAAHRAKMRCIGVGSANHLDKADLVISSFEDINVEDLEKLKRQVKDTQ